LPQGVQIVTSTAGGYQLVSSQVTGRPLLVSPAGRGANPGQGVPRQAPPRLQNILIRNGSTALPPNPPVQRQYAPQAGSTTVSNLSLPNKVILNARYPAPATVFSPFPKFVLVSQLFTTNHFNWKG